MEYLYVAVLFPTKEKSKVGEFEWEMRENQMPLEIGPL
jgi:hypothetical protein